MTLSEFEKRLVILFLILNQAPQSGSECWLQGACSYFRHLDTLGTSFSKEIPKSQFSTSLRFSKSLFPEIEILTRIDGVSPISQKGLWSGVLCRGSHILRAKLTFDCVLMLVHPIYSGVHGI